MVASTRIRLRQVLLNRALSRIKAISSAIAGARQSSSIPVFGTSPSRYTIHAASHRPRIMPGMEKLPRLKSEKAAAKEPYTSVLKYQWISLAKNRPSTVPIGNRTRIARRLSARWR